MPDPYTVEQYLLADYPRTLFPLNTTKVLVESSSARIKDFLYQELLPQAGAVPGFLIQQRCHAAKRGHHLRRTLKLDPVAEFFIYDVVFRNRRSFKQDARPTRASFGYRFPGGRPESNTDAYANFKRALAKSRSRAALTLKADIATYFNSIYHHDLVNMAQSIGWSEADAQALGRFLREINAGRSIDCLPHGMHPCKVLGSEFLRFVDDSYRLRSGVGLRFMDDMHFFDDKETTLTSDHLTLQELLGERGLSLNETKTAIGKTAEIDVPVAVDAVKQQLLQLRRRTIDVSGIEVEVGEESPRLNGGQIDYLLGLVQTPDIEESDAELVLVLLRNHAEAVFPSMARLLTKFPGLTRNVYFYSRLAKDTTGLDAIVETYLRTTDNATEYQLFWLTKIAEDVLVDSPLLGNILMAALEHPRATALSRAKVLEIADNRFGLPELREQVLRSGKSDWEAWAAAAGFRGEAAARRNQLLKYFAKGSPINGVIADCISCLP